MEELGPHSWYPLLTAHRDDPRDRDGVVATRGLDPDRQTEVDGLGRGLRSSAGGLGSCLRPSSEAALRHVSGPFHLHTEASQFEGFFEPDSTPRLRIQGYSSTAERASRSAPQSPVASTPPPPQEEPFSESHLGSPEYRDRLMRKLNCLIAVLEVATAKVKKSMDGSPPDAERLARICANLQSTLEVCQRARTALEKRQAANGQQSPDSKERALTVTPPPPTAPPRRSRAAPRSKDEKPAKGAASNPPKRPPVRWGKGIRGPSSDITTEAERKKFAKLPPIDRKTIASCDIEELSRRLTS